MRVRMARLGDVCARISDGTHQAPNWAASGVPFLFVSNIRNGTISFETSKFVSRVEYEKLTKNCPIEAGDVLYTAVGSYGNSAVVPSGKTFVFQRHIAHLKPRHDLIDATYLSQMLETPPVRRQADKLARGVAQKTVTLSSLRDFEIPLPPLDEQKRIAAILDKADQLRQKRRQAIALLDSLTQSIFLEMFGDPVSNPKGWPTVSVDDLCALVVDCVNRTAPLAEHPTAFKMIRTTNVKNGNLLLSEVRYVEAEVFQRWNRRATPEIGDVLLTREAPVGEVGILETPGNFFLGQRLMLYRPDLRRMTSEFLATSFRSAFLLEQFRQSSSGSTVKHLPLPACRSFVFRVPPIELQQKFSKRVLSLKNTLSSQVIMSSQLGNLFASLQHRAFSGQL